MIRFSDAYVNINRLAGMNILSGFGPPSNHLIDSLVVELFLITGSSEYVDYSMCERLNPIELSLTVLKPLRLNPYCSLYYRNTLATAHSNGLIESSPRQILCVVQNHHTHARDRTRYNIFQVRAESENNINCFMYVMVLWII